MTHAHWKKMPGNFGSASYELPARNTALRWAISASAVYSGPSMLNTALSSHSGIDSRVGKLVKVYSGRTTSLRSAPIHDFAPRSC